MVAHDGQVVKGPSKGAGFEVDFQFTAEQKQGRGELRDNRERRDRRPQSQVWEGERSSLFMRWLSRSGPSWDRSLGPFGSSPLPFYIYVVSIQKKKKKNKKKKKRKKNSTVLMLLVPPRKPNERRLRSFVLERVCKGSGKQNRALARINTPPDGEHIRRWSTVGSIVPAKRDSDSSFAPHPEEPKWP